MPPSTSASRFLAVLVALCALGGCAPLEGEDDLLLDESEQAPITEVGVRALDGKSKDPPSTVAKKQSATTLQLGAGDLGSAHVFGTLGDPLRDNWRPEGERCSSQRTVELVLRDASVDEVEALLHGERSATLTSYDEDGSPVIEIKLLGARLVGRPKVVAFPARQLSVKLAYDALSMATP